MNYLFHALMALSLVLIPPCHAEYIPLGPNEVNIAFSGIEVPSGRILLVRNKSEYCAIRFTKYWEEKDIKNNWTNKYSDYEVYCQKDGSGDFKKHNVLFIKSNASLLRPRGPFYPLIWNPGNTYVNCGSFKLGWFPAGFVGFYKQRDPPKGHGVDLAPTPWLDMSQVNVFDKRIKWHRYDKERKNIRIPVELLWQDTTADDARKQENFGKE